MPKLSIVIPVYNEAATVEELLGRVWNQELEGIEKELIVVESHSTDGSREIVQRFLSQKSTTSWVSFRLILQDAPNGKGNAVREGLDAATGDIILIQDADLEYSTSDYPALLEPILSGKAEFVLGSRHLGAGHWKIRKFEVHPLKAVLLNWGGAFFHTFFNILFHQHLTDPTTMYKVFKRECLNGIRLRANRFDFDFELLGNLLLKGYEPFEVPVSYASRGFAEGKKIHVFRDPLTWIWVMLKVRFGSLGDDHSILSRWARKKT